MAASRESKTNIVVDVFTMLTIVAGSMFLLSLIDPRVEKFFENMHDKISHSSADKNPNPTCVGQLCINSKTDKLAVNEIDWTESLEDAVYQPFKVCGLIPGTMIMEHGQYRSQIVSGTCWQEHYSTRF